MKSLLTVLEAAKILNCSSRTVYRLAKGGELKACRIRNSIRIVADSLDLYIEKSISQFQLEHGVYNYSEKNSD